MGLKVFYENHHLMVDHGGSPNPAKIILGEFRLEMIITEKYLTFMYTSCCRKRSILNVYFFLHSTYLVFFYALSPSFPV